MPCNEINILISEHTDTAIKEMGNSQRSQIIHKYIPDKNDLPDHANTTSAAVKSDGETFSPNYLELDEKKKIKLNELFDEIDKKASIDYSNKEIKDIKTAVHTMLARIAGRVNKRRRFTIAGIRACGSMAEQSSVWKYGEQTGERYTEFDFLAELEFSMLIIDSVACDLSQCAAVSVRPPLPNGDMGTLLKEYNISRLDNDSDRSLCDKLFWREINICLGSACQCLSVEFVDLNPNSPNVSYHLTQNHLSDKCKECVVEMATGILRVNDSLCVGPGEEANCSLAFRWTSKANLLSACDQLLHEKARQINSLSVYVDFLPALPVDRIAQTYLVPKRCNLCRADDRWRLSHFHVETSYLVSKMTEKHRKCYKIIKYCLSKFKDENCFYVRWYHVKTAALTHSLECKDSSDACAECVLKILTDLKRAYEFRTLYSFHKPSVNIFNPPKFSNENKIFQDAIERFCSVTINDSCNTLLQPMEYTKKTK